MSEPDQPADLPTQGAVGPDWERIEALYRAGVMSVRQIAREVGGITEAAIRKRAKSRGWTSDLNPVIRSRADDIVAKKAAGKDAGSRLTKKQESEVVEINAQLMATTQLQHRSDIRNTRDLFIKLLTELHGATVNPDLFDTLLDELAAPPDGAEGDEKAQERARKKRERMQEALMKAISMPSRIDSAKKLSETLEKLVRMEREAIGLDKIDPGKTGDGVNDFRAAHIEARRRAGFPV